MLQVARLLEPCTVRSYTSVRPHGETSTKRTTSVVLLLCRNTSAAHCRSCYIIIHPREPSCTQIIVTVSGYVAQCGNTPTATRQRVLLDAASCNAHRIHCMMWTLPAFTQYPATHSPNEACQTSCERCPGMP